MDHSLSRLSSIGYQVVNKEKKIDHNLHHKKVGKNRYNFINMVKQLKKCNE
jgi:hypothetical protein